MLECTSPALKRAIRVSNLWHKLTVHQDPYTWAPLWDHITSAVATKDVCEVCLDYESLKSEFLLYLCDVEQAAAGRPLRFTGRVARVEYPRIVGCFTYPRSEDGVVNYDSEEGRHFDVASEPWCTCGVGSEREFSFIARHFPRVTIVFEGADTGADYGPPPEYLELSPPELRGVISAIDNFLQRLSFTGDVCLGNYRIVATYSYGQDYSLIREYNREPDDPPPDLPERKSYRCNTGTCLFLDASGSVRVDHPDDIHFDSLTDCLLGQNDIYFKHEWTTWSVGKLAAP